MHKNRRVKTKVERFICWALQLNSRTSNRIHRTSSKSQGYVRPRKIWLEAAVHYFNTRKRFKRMITKKSKRKMIRIKRMGMMRKKKYCLLSQRVNFRRQYRRHRSKATTYTSTKWQRKHPSQTRHRRKKTRIKGVGWNLVDTQLKRLDRSVRRYRLASQLRRRWHWSRRALAGEALRRRRRSSASLRNRQRRSKLCSNHSKHHSL